MAPEQRVESLIYYNDKAAQRPSPPLSTPLNHIQVRL